MFFYAVGTLRAARVRKRWGDVEDKPPQAVWFCKTTTAPLRYRKARKAATWGPRSGRGSDRSYQRRISPRLLETPPACEASFLGLTGPAMFGHD